MAKGTILKTNKGIFLMGSIECSNGSKFDADGCYRYCNESDCDMVLTRVRVNNLIEVATLLSREVLADKSWYEYRNNFIDVDVDFECDQSYMDRQQNIIQI